MTHTLPLLGELPLSETSSRYATKSETRLLAIASRSRGLLSEVGSKKGRAGKREVKQMFEEQIEPELLKMKQELRLEQDRQVRRLAGGLSYQLTAASVGFGAVGMVPAALAAGTVWSGIA